MQNKIPLVSIVMPTQNRGYSLKKSIESVKKQKFQNWELFIIDNFSTDSTPEMMKNYCNEDDRINYISVPKSESNGISEYLNIGIKRSKGKYIARLDDDDYWYDEDKLNLQFNFLEENPDYCIVGGGIIIVDEEGKNKFKYLKKEKDKDIRNYSLFANPFSHTTVMFRKDIAKKNGYYPSGLIEDWQLWLKMGLEYKFYNFPRYFTCYKSAGHNLSFKNQRIQSKSILKLVKQYKNNYPHYYKAYLLNFTQYLYTYLPKFIRKPLQSFMFYLKRKNF